jgi:hypothetical protein
MHGGLLHGAAHGVLKKPEITVAAEQGVVTGKRDDGLPAASRALGTR